MTSRYPLLRAKEQFRNKSPWSNLSPISAGDPAPEAPALLLRDPAWPGVESSRAANAQSPVIAHKSAFNRHSNRFLKAYRYPQEFHRNSVRYLNSSRSLTTD
jgi:hypothetical protein